MSHLLFVIPNTRWFDSPKWEIYPYNVCLLAAVIRPYYEVDILDCNAKDLSLEETLRQIAAYDPEYGGITCMAVEYSRHAHLIADGIKKVLPEITVILGGVYCTLMPDVVMQHLSIDYCVLGEGEVVLKKLLDCLEHRLLPKYLDGVAYRENGSLIIKPQKEFIEDLDALPLPAFDKVDFSNYGYVNQKFSFTDTRDAVPVAKIYASRGCPAGCNFCAVEHIAGRKFRCRSVESILDEIQFMINTYGVKEIVFYDDNLLFNGQRAKKVFQGIIERKFNIKIKPANVAVYCLDKEMLELMKEAGCTLLVFAIESSSNRVLHKIMGKPLSVENVPPIVEYAKRLGFRCAALFIIGSLGETWDEIRHTFSFAEHLDIYCHFSIATPLPKTRLYKDAAKHGCLTRDFNFAAGAGCSKGWLLTSEFSPFDLEALRVYEWDRINFSSPERRARSAAFFQVSEAEIQEFARGARKAIQLRYVQERYKRLV